jgi:hypothetical protein
MNKKVPFLIDAQRGGLVIAVPGVFAESFPTRRLNFLPSSKRFCRYLHSTASAAVLWLRCGASAAFAVEKVSETVIVVGWVHGASNGPSEACRAPFMTTPLRVNKERGHFVHGAAPLFRRRGIRGAPIRYCRFPALRTSKSS